MTSMRKLRAVLLLGSPFFAWLVWPACSSNNPSPAPSDGGSGGGAEGGASSGAAGSSSSGSSGAGSGGGATSSGASGGATSSSSSGGNGSSSGGGTVHDAAAGDTAPTVDSGGDATTPQGCAASALCDDFESDAPGGPPKASLWSVTAAKGCSGQSSYSVTIDSTQAHSGKQSLKVVGGDSCGPMMVNASAFTKLTGGDVYGRFYTQLSSPMPVHHAALMALGFAPDAGPLGNNTKQYLQLAAEEASNPDGGSGAMLDWNYNDLTLPQKDSMGFVQTTYPVAGAWTCVEFHAAPASGAIEVWVDGAAVPGMTYVPGVTTDSQGVNGGWNAGRPKPLSVQSIGFGWIDFSSAGTTLWFDDVALAGARVGCM
jgi:hypothetical protein